MPAFDWISFDPQILGGRACIRGMRIPVSVILGQIEKGTGHHLRLHGISTWRTDRQDFESRTKQIKALPLKKCLVPFQGGLALTTKKWPGPPL
jgi:hypothetical protein